MAGDQERVGVTAVDRHGVEELRPQILVGVAEPELAGRYVDEVGRNRRRAGKAQVDLAALAALELEGVAPSSA